MTDAATAHPPIDWAAIIAGTVLATALGLILLAFGAGLGLSVTSPFEGEGLAPAFYVIAAGLWMLWVQVLCFSIGGYTAARLRRRQTGVSEHETIVRDGFHGLIVWGAGVIAAALISLSFIGGAVATGESMPEDSIAGSISEAVTSEIDQAAASDAATDADASDETLAERRAEIARKLAIIAAFITAASLFAGAAAAFYAAESGGRHRDKGRHLKFYALTRAERAAEAAAASETAPVPAP